MVSLCFYDGRLSYSAWQAMSSQWPARDPGPMTIAFVPSRFAGSSQATSGGHRPGGSPRNGVLRDGWDGNAVHLRAVRDQHLSGGLSPLTRAPVTSLTDKRSCSYARRFRPSDNNCACHPLRSVVFSAIYIHAARQLSRPLLMPLPSVITLVANCFSSCRSNLRGG